MDKIKKSKSPMVRKPNQANTIEQLKEQSHIKDKMKEMGFLGKKMRSTKTKYAMEPLLQMIFDDMSNDVEFLIKMGNI